MRYLLLFTILLSGCQALAPYTVNESAFLDTCVVHNSLTWCRIHLYEWRDARSAVQSAPTVQALVCESPSQ